MKLLIILLTLIIFSNCNRFYIKNYQAYKLKEINVRNFKSYEVFLEPYEFKILFISNYYKKYLGETNKWWYDAIVYQVYIRSFYDSDNDGFGDIEGLIEKLDYITNLGFNCIWTLPLFESYYDGSIGRALGYEPIDYYNIHHHYGKLSDFDRYVKESHKRGVKVILDLVLNHTSLNNPWFIASSTNDSFYKDWYKWTNISIEILDNSKWQLPWGGGKAYNVWHYNSLRQMYYYGTWGAELNYRDENVINESFKIANFWLNRGVDGFRLDAIRYLIEEGPYPLQADTKSTLDYIEKLQSNIRSINSNIISIGEVWTSDHVANKYILDGKGLDQVFSFDFNYAINDSLISENALSLKGYLYSRPKKSSFKNFGLFLDNHDLKRYFSRLDDNFMKAKLAISVLMTFPGTPYVYFGSEIGMKHHYSPMQWCECSNGGFSLSKPWLKLYCCKNPFNVDYQLKEYNSLLNWYKKMIKFRNDNFVLRQGNIKLIKNDKKSVISYIRPGEEGTFLIVANFCMNKIITKLNFEGSGLEPNEVYYVYQILNN